MEVWRRTRGGGEICLFPEGKPSFYLSYEQANATRVEIWFAIKIYMGKLNAPSSWTSHCEGKEDIYCMKLSLKNPSSHTIPFLRADPSSEWSSYILLRSSRLRLKLSDRNPKPQNLMPIWVGCLSQGGGAHMCRARMNMVICAVGIGWEVGPSAMCRDL